MDIMFEVDLERRVNEVIKKIKGIYNISPNVIDEAGKRDKRVGYILELILKALLIGAKAGYEVRNDQVYIVVIKEGEIRYVDVYKYVEDVLDQNPLLSQYDSWMVILVSTWGEVSIRCVSPGVIEFE